MLTRGVMVIYCIMVRDEKALYWKSLQVTVRYCKKQNSRNCFDTLLKQINITVWMVSVV